MSGARRSARRLLAIAVALPLLAGAAGAAWAWLALHRPYAGWSGDAVDVRLESGLDAASMLARLADAGVIRDRRLARAWLVWSGGAGRLQAGEFRFSEPASTLEVLERIARGDVLLHPVTLPEGLTAVEVAERLAAADFGPAEAFVVVFADPTPIADLDPEATDLEGYLFPDTYRFERTVTPERVVEAMVGRFREATGPGYVAEAEASGLGLRGAVILASMIERETSVPSERGRIARVFINRLDRGMKLECDPTVIYAIEREGREVERLTYADLRFESAWNTYHTPGLPAGPIANPGKESLLAAVRPDPGPELFFVAAPDGGHRFSRNMSEHLKAVAEWRRHVRSSR